MEEKLKIKVTIGDRVYPLTINSEGEEEGVRKAVKKINDLIKRFEENYEVRDKQDVLAMCALQFASLQEVKSIYNEKDGEEIERKLLEMSTILDTYL
ncbi:cell division protein ZapA [Aureibaculum marinum]|uniref:Cell division protein ZapA n=1 Tax=Aureibaculum marinum TaxID=2487930 RepID=A0A3N4P4R4_9FLAO|nr:cell division protein ZapA [Aureibaculum marinum]RPD99906.1 cell division protein ZapA [Aureibaculum marinum]